MREPVVDNCEGSAGYLAAWLLLLLELLRQALERTVAEAKGCPEVGLRALFKTSRGVVL